MEVPLEERLGRSQIESVKVVIAFFKKLLRRREPSTEQRILTRYMR